MVTVRLSRDGDHAVFETVPPGYANNKAASEAMRSVADQYWGTAGPAFVKGIVRELENDEERFRSVVARALARYASLDRSLLSSARAQKTFALAAVAATLAQKWCIFPKSWGSPERMMQSVALAMSQTAATKEGDTKRAIQEYIERRRDGLIDVAHLPRPMNKTDFEASEGFLRKRAGATELLVPSARFRAAFPKHKAIMQELRAAGDAVTEGGRRPKLTIKTSVAICASGRVYCVRV